MRKNGEKRQKIGKMRKNGEKRQKIGLNSKKSVTVLENMAFVSVKNLFI